MDQEYERVNGPGSVVTEIEKLVVGDNYTGPWFDESTDPKKVGEHMDLVPLTGFPVAEGVVFFVDDEGNGPLHPSMGDAIDIMEGRSSNKNPEAVDKVHEILQKADKYLEDNPEFFKKMQEEIKKITGKGMPKGGKVLVLEGDLMEKLSETQNQEQKKKAEEESQ